MAWDIIDVKMMLMTVQPQLNEVFLFILSTSHVIQWIIIACFVILLYQMWRTWNCTQLYIISYCYRNTPIKLSRINRKQSNLLINYLESIAVYFLKWLLLLALPLNNFFQLFYHWTTVERYYIKWTFFCIWCKIFQQAVWKFTESTIIWSSLFY